MKLNELRVVNMELNQQVDDTKKEKDELATAKERLQREMDKLRNELRAVKEDLSSAESDRVGAMEEVKAMKQLMFETQEHDVRVGVRLLKQCSWGTTTASTFFGGHLSGHSACPKYGLPEMTSTSALI